MIEFTKLLILACIGSFLNSSLAKADEFRRQFEPIKDKTQICNPSFCSNLTMISKDVLNFCTKNNYKIDSRCCYDNSTLNSSTTIGLDYSSCQIDKLTVAFNSIDMNLTKLIEILDLRDNIIKECDVESYAGFVNLNYLYIPYPSVLNCSCPGANFSWTSYSNGACSNRINICNTTYSNVECTEQSVCSDNGPGNFLCNCKQGYEGYKCLYQGQFPTLMFTVILCSVTIFLSGILWHTQRRHVKKKNI